jgi:uncharacterized OB-fold protein
VTGRVEPPESEEGQPFWDATRARRLILPWCLECGKPFWYPRAVCPRCLSARIEWREASGRGSIYAASVQHTAAVPQMADRTPYVVALIDLDEGVRMMSNVVGCEPYAARAGMAVQVGWEALSDGRCLPVFEPAGAADATG